MSKYLMLLIISLIFIAVTACGGGAAEIPSSDSPRGAELMPMTPADEAEAVANSNSMTGDMPLPDPASPNEPMPPAMPPAPPALSAIGKPTDPTGATPKDKVIYLTFDDGPARPWTPQVLDLLARYHAHATFFVVGHSARVYPDVIQAIVDGGHALGNHTYDHVWLSRVGHDKFFTQVKQTQDVLGNLASSCMRPPYGATNAHTRAYAAELGLSVVMWNIDPFDWRRPAAARIASYIVARAYPGATVLMHDGGGNRSQTVAALDSILRELSQRGYRFETEPPCRRAAARDAIGHALPVTSPP